MFEIRCVHCGDILARFHLQDPAAPTISALKRHLQDCNPKEPK